MSVMKYNPAMELTKEQITELGKDLGIKNWKQYDDDWHECLSLLDRSVPNGSGKPARFCRAHTGSGGSGNIILVKWLIMKTRNLSSTPNSARRLLDEAIKLYVSNNAAPMVRRARETFHNRDVCAEDGWLFGDENTRGSGNSSRRTNNGGAVHPETRLIGHRILLASVGSFGTVWAYHPKHKMWKVQLEPLDALGYNDIDAGDFEGCGIERIPESRGGGFRVKENKAALAKLEKKIRATGTAKRPRLSSSVTAGSGGSGTSSSSPSFSSRRLSSPSSGSRSSSRISGASSDRRSTGGSSSSSWKRGGGRGRGDSMTEDDEGANDDSTNDEDEVGNTDHDKDEYFGEEGESKKEVNARAMLSSAGLSRRASAVGSKRDRTGAFAGAQAEILPANGLVLVNDGMSTYFNTCDVPWPARILSVEEVRIYHAVGALIDAFPKNPGRDVAVVLLFPPKIPENFSIQVCSIDDLFLIEQNTRKNALRIRSESVRARFEQGMVVAEMLSSYAKKYKLGPVPPERLDFFLKSAFHPTQLNVVRYPDFILESDWEAIVKQELKKQASSITSGSSNGCEGTGITANGSNTNGGSSGGDDKSSGGSRSQSESPISLLAPDTLPIVVSVEATDEERSRCMFLKPKPRDAREDMWIPEADVKDQERLLLALQQQHERHQQHQQRQQHAILASTLESQHSGGKRKETEAIKKLARLAAKLSKADAKIATESDTPLFKGQDLFSDERQQQQGNKCANADRLLTIPTSRLTKQGQKSSEEKKGKALGSPLSTLNVQQSVQGHGVKIVPKGASHAIAISNAGPRSIENSDNGAINLVQDFGRPHGHDSQYKGPQYDRVTAEAKSSLVSEGKVYVTSTKTSENQAIVSDATSTTTVDAAKNTSDNAVLKKPEAHTSNVSGPAVNIEVTSAPKIQSLVTATTATHVNSAIDIDGSKEGKGMIASTAAALLSNSAVEGAPIRAQAQVTVKNSVNVSNMSNGINNGNLSNNSTLPSVSNIACTSKSSVSVSCMNRDLMELRLAYRQAVSQNAASRKDGQAMYRLFSAGRCEAAHLKVHMDAIAAAAANAESLRAHISERILDAVRRRDMALALELVSIAGLCQARSEVDRLALEAISKGDTALALELSELISHST